MATGWVSFVYVYQQLYAHARYVMGRAKKAQMRLKETLWVHRRRRSRKEGRHLMTRCACKGLASLLFLLALLLLFDTLDGLNNKRWVGQGDGQRGAGLAKRAGRMLYLQPVPRFVPQPRR